VKKGKRSLPDFASVPSSSALLFTLSESDSQNEPKEEFRKIIKQQIAEASYCLLAHSSLKLTETFTERRIMIADQTETVAFSSRLEFLPSF